MTRPVLAILAIWAVGLWCGRRRHRVPGLTCGAANPYLSAQVYLACPDSVQPVRASLRVEVPMTRPHTQRRHTIRGRYGIYTVPTIAATDTRCRILAGMLPGATHEVAARIRHDLDLLLEHRMALTGREAIA